MLSRLLELDSPHLFSRKTYFRTPGTGANTSVAISVSKEIHPAVRKEEEELLDEGRCWQFLTGSGAPWRGPCPPLPKPAS